MKKPKKVGRPQKSTKKGVSYKEYKKIRKQVGSKISYGSKKTGISDFGILMPKIPKVITEGSIRKLERLSEKLSIALNEGKLEQLYRQKKRKIEPPAPPVPPVPPEGPDAPRLEDLIIEDYRGYIELVRDDNEVMYEQYNKYSNWSPGRGREIEEHCDNCLTMLEDIGAFSYNKYQVALNLWENLQSVYDDTEAYLLYYLSYEDEAYGEAVFERIHTALVKSNGGIITLKDKKAYAERLARYGYYMEGDYLD